GVEGGFGVIPYKGVQLGVTLAMCARTEFAAAIGIERRLVDDLAGDTDGIAKFLPVLSGAHVVEQDARVLAWIFRGEPYAAATGRAHGADVGLEAVFLHRVAAVVVDRHRQEVELDVRPFEVGTGADETACLEVIAGSDAIAGEQPLCADGRLVPPL